MDTMRKLFIILFLLLNSVVQLTAAPAADFNLPNAEGDQQSLSQYAGQVVLINFWASWCPPCIKEMPELQSLHDKYKGLGFSVVGINIDDDSEIAKRIISKFSINYPIVFDASKATSKSYQVKGMPASFLIDKNGELRESYIGYNETSIQKYLDDVRTLLRE